MNRPVGVKLTVVLFALLALNGLAQGILVFIEGNDDPMAVTLFQLASGVAGLATAIGAWKGSRWSSLASVAYGLITSAMLACLPYLLGLGDDEKMGIWSGAAIVLLFSVAAGWYLHRQHARGAANG